MQLQQPPSGTIVSSSSQTPWVVVSSHPPLLLIQLLLLPLWASFAAGVAVGAVLGAPQGRQAPTVVVHLAYWHTFVCNLRRMISPAPAKFSQRPGISPDDARAHTGNGALGVEGWVQRTGVVRTGILGPPSQEGVYLPMGRRLEDTEEND